MYNLTNKIALVTGASRGIGHCIAKTLCNKEPPKRFKCSGVKKKTAKHKLETKVKMKAGNSLRARLL